jgi:hypothetical protein
MNGSTGAKDEMTESATITLHDMPNDVLDFLMGHLTEAEDSQREGTCTSVRICVRCVACVALCAFVVCVRVVCVCCVCVM